MVLHEGTPYVARFEKRKEKQILTPVQAGLNPIVLDNKYVVPYFSVVYLLREYVTAS